MINEEIIVIQLTLYGALAILGLATTFKSPYGVRSKRESSND
jgi:hypothetical protein